MVNPFFSPWNPYFPHPMCDRKRTFCTKGQVTKKTDEPQNEEVAVVIQPFECSDT